MPSFIYSQEKENIANKSFIFLYASKTNYEIIATNSDRIDISFVGWLYSNW